jgi:hypothetical protein
MGVICDKSCNRMWVILRKPCCYGKQIVISYQSRPVKYIGFLLISHPGIDRILTIDSSHQSV